MIKIRVSPDKMKEIEEKHWTWFEQKCLKKLNIINEDKFGLFDKILDDEEKKLYGILYKEREIIINGNIENLSKIIIKLKDNKFLENRNQYIMAIKKRDKTNIKKLKEQLFIKNDFLAKINCNGKEDELKSSLNEINEFLKSKELEEIKYFDKDTKGVLKEKIVEFKANIQILKLKKDKFIVEEIFNYDEFSKTKESKIEYKNESIFWGRHSLLCDLGIEVCPYCNRQYINKFEYEGSNKTTGDLDHFFIKSKYPYLALSLYNFIPSCQICNRTFKGDEDFYNENFSNDDKSYNAIYPYNEGFGDKTKFTVEFYKDKEESKNYDPDVLTGNSNNFQIKIDIKESDVKKTKRIENSLKTFKLREVYRENHKDYIRDIIRKAIIYNESRIDELFKEYEGTLFKNREDVVSMIVSNYIDEEDLDKRVLAKLTKDISEELGLK